MTGQTLVNSKILDAILKLMETFFHYEVFSYRKEERFPCQVSCVYVLATKCYFYIELSNLTFSHSKFKLHDKAKSEPFKATGLIYKLCI